MDRVNERYEPCCNDAAIAEPSKQAAGNAAGLHGSSGRARRYMYDKLGSASYDQPKRNPASDIYIGKH